MYVLSIHEGILFFLFLYPHFLLSFGIGIKEKSKITTILLIAGGAIIGTSVLGAVAMAKGGLTAIQSSFLVVVIIGYVIMGLGILRRFQKK